MSEVFNEYLVLRSFIPSMDQDFIFSTFMKGLYFGTDDYRLIKKDIFLNNYQKILESLFRRGANVNILVLKKDPRIIVSYCVYIEDRLFWVHTKHDWRKMKLTKLIIPHTIKVVVHLSKIGKAILKKHPELTYNPFF